MWRSALCKTAGILGIVGLVLGLAACGSSPGERAVSGGLLGAGGGAAIGSAAGNTGAGALIGGAAGAGLGAITADDNHK